LDAEDPIVRRRVIQKMTFLAQDSVAAKDPGDAVLREFYGKHAPEFELPRRVSLRHVFFSRQRRGDHAEKDARESLSRLDATTPLEQATALGDAAIMGSHLVMRTEEDLRSTFGGDFGSRVFGANPGVWFGPVSSERGVHLVFVEAQDKGGRPEFSEVRSAVYAAWALEEQRSSRQKLLEQLRHVYRVEIAPDAAQALSVSKAGP
jgi:peptidyl-prolyl cis-trans isomerase C